ncbi:MAG: hypothetical protein RI563_04815 [Thiohalophilus sp.]|uniref:hypothetical protein n=1 Tax=Thiohalophilus sp. TaxID=3028392 RepID=UPI00287099E0|nr:hypothetical protein [Thiohalophilus sp.]MDR9436174.1 hypothetical protein [Thiohalophilus sp.]
MRIDIDPDSDVVQEQFAVVYCPRRKRDRFPEGSVEVVASSEAALAGANPDKNLYPAMVVGPSRSSEGARLYYLVEWLEPGNHEHQ